MVEAAIPAAAAAAAVVEVVEVGAVVVINHTRTQPSQVFKSCESFKYTQSCPALQVEPG